LNSELADTFGNLLSRACATSLNPHQKFLAVNQEQLSALMKLECCTSLIKKLNELPEKCHQHYSSNNFHLVVDSVMEALRDANNFFETTKPWTLKKGNKEAIESLETIISLTLESLRICAIILQPVIPEFTGQLLTRLNVPEAKRLWKDTRVSLKEVSSDLVELESNILFQRIILQTDKVIKKKKK